MSSLREAAIVLAQRDCSLHIPSQSTAREDCEQFRPVTVRADADVSGANSSPSGPLHPERRAAGLGHRWLMPPHPRSDSSWPKREGSRVATRQLRSNNRADAWLLTPPLGLVSPSAATSSHLPSLGLGGGQGAAAKQPGRHPRGPRPPGAARCRPLPCGIVAEAPNPRAREPLRRGVAPAYSLSRTAVAPLPSPPWPRRPGTRRRSGAGSARAR